MDDVIYLDPDDDAAILIAKLESTRSPMPAVVVPRGHRVFCDPAHVERLWRFAERIDKAVIIVSKDRDIRSMAEEQGFRVAPSLRKAGFVPRPAGMRFWDWNWRFPVIVAATLVIVLVPAAYAVIFLLPSTVITLAPVSEPAAKVINITAGDDIDKVSVAEGKIPARPLEVLLETSGQVATVGGKLVPDKPARGQVTLLNRTGDAITVPQGTRVGTLNAVTFRTTSDVSLPAGEQSRATVEIIAELPGETGNVPALAINRIYEGQLSLMLAVFNEEGTSGGTDKEAHPVSEGDRQRVRQRVMEAAKQDGLREMESLRLDDEAVLPGSLVPRMLEETFDAQVGEDRAVLSLNAKVAVRGLAVRAADLERVVAGQMEKLQGQPVYLMKNTLQAEMVDARYVATDKLWFQVYAKGRVLTDVDEAKLQKTLAGQPVTAARDYLASAYQLVRPPEIQVSPDWFGTISRTASRITIRILEIPEG